MGSVTVAISPKGFRYAVKDGIRLNSSYNPYKEAVEYIRSEVKQTPGTIILSGCTLGYLIEALFALYPRSRLLCFFYDPVLMDFAKERLGHLFPPSCLVNPSRLDDINRFLQNNLLESDMEGLILLEWPPSTRLYTEEATFLRTCLAQKVREMNGSITATRIFGRRWVKNAFHNFLALKQFLAPVPTDLPVVITGSGPSLHQSLSFIRTHRSRIFLLSLSSSIETVTSSGLFPDGIVTTDPGFWATVLLRYAPEAPLFMPLTAALPSELRTAASVVVIGQNSFYEQALFHHVLTPPFSIPSGGTVASTAVNLAMQVSTGPVIVTGIDFSYPDIFLHCRPHPFDILDDLRTDRLSPLLSILWKRSHTDDLEVLPRGSRRTLPMKTYAGWFGKTFSHNRGRIFRLHPSEVEIPDFIPLSQEKADRLVSPFPEKRQGLSFHQITPDKAVREKRVSETLHSWEAMLHNVPISFTGQGEILWKDPGIFDLCYTCNIEDMLELQGLIRKGEHEKIPAVLADMIKGLGAFIEELRQ
ncbi:MAG: DUF115 domain-containing protein [Spirochaetales bacterium]|nr:DUF115 domain-containing protein [Spirochaetales bacterium]